MCSTPFGITDYIGFTHGVYDPWVRSCSTPFGITDYIGLIELDEAIISASVLNAFRHHGLYREPHGPASVPFVPHVLNAFRHHGLYRAAALGRSPAAPRGAQRLSASRIISAPVSAASVTASRGAQRLSASRIISAGNAAILF